MCMCITAGLYVYRRTCTYGFLCICVHMNVQARGQSWVSFLRSCPPYLLRLLECTKKAKLAGRYQQSIFLHLLSTGITSVCHHTWLFFYMRYGLQNQVCIHKESTLLIKPSPSPYLLNYHASNRCQSLQSLGPKAKRWTKDSSYHLRLYHLVKQTGIESYE